MLKTHYRSPLDWTLKSAGRERRRRSTTGTPIAADAETAVEPSPAVIEALYDDLNTAQMPWRSLHGLRNAAASGGEQERGEFAASLRLLGFLSMSAGGMEGPQAAGKRHRSRSRSIA